MNKAKVILSAIAILAIVGATMASKSSKRAAGIYFTRTGTTTIDGATFAQCGTPDYLTSATGGLTTTLYKATLGSNICTTPFTTLHGIFIDV
jgi:ABC-type protease/lipase transport system fused ATPase/permease subunit